MILSLLNSPPKKSGPSRSHLTHSLESTRVAGQTVSLSLSVGISSIAWRSSGIALGVSLFLPVSPFRISSSDGKSRAGMRSLLSCCSQKEQLFIVVIHVIVVICSAVGGQATIAAGSSKIICV